MAVGGRASQSTWAQMRRSALIALALGTALLTSGCSVYINGMTGIGVDEQGRLVGYLQVCGSRVTTATLWSADGQPVGEWSPPSDITDYATWLLDGSSEGWSTDTEPPALVPGAMYRLNAYKSNIIDGDTRTVSVPFTMDDLKGLRPGQVLSIGTALDEEPRRTRVTTVDEFRDSACTVLYGEPSDSPSPSTSS